MVMFHSFLCYVNVYQRVCHGNVGGYPGPFLIAWIIPARRRRFLLIPQNWCFGSINHQPQLVLVGGLEHFLLFHILGSLWSQLTNSYFSEGWRKATNQSLIHGKYGVSHGATSLTNPKTHKSVLSKTIFAFYRRYDGNAIQIIGEIRTNQLVNGWWGGCLTS